MTSLNSLDVSGSKVSEAGVKDLQSALPKCRISASLIGPKYAAVAAFRKHGGIVSLTRKTSGEPYSAGLRGPDVTDAGLVYLAQMTSLKFLLLSGPQVTDAGLTHLKEMTSLLELTLKDTEVTDAGLVHLKGLASLQKLDLSGSKVSGAGVKDLQTALPKCEITK